MKVEIVEEHNNKSQFVYVLSDSSGISYSHCTVLRMIPITNFELPILSISDIDHTCQNGQGRKKRLKNESKRSMQI